MSGFDREMTIEEAARLLPKRLPDSNKGDHGWLLIVAGSAGMPGAGVLAAMGAYRSGAGRVTVASVPSVLEAVTRQLPEALLLALPEFDGAIAEGASTILQAKKDAFTGAVFGPGLTTGTGVHLCLGSLWKEWDVPSVLDADALNLISGGLKLPKGANVLTPHPGEMARLLDCSVDEIQANRERAALQAAIKFKSTVLLKGERTQVATPDGVIWVNSTGNPGMASAGMGDVLSGVIGTLIAQKLSPIDAARLGAFWHGLAGDLAAERIGAVGFTAGDVARLLPSARDVIVSVRERKG